MARVALVTGGTRGIGEAICKALKAAGYKVAANYGGNDEAAQKFKAATGIPVFKWDVSNFEACAEGVKKVEAELGPIEVLVNNAGITRDTMFHRMTPQQWNEVIGTNLGSLFNMTRQVIEGMRARKFGRIVNISSINGQKGQMGQVNYSAAKAGDIGFTKALAQEGAKSGITVNAICPGYIATEMVKAVPQDVLEKSILPHIPTGRLGEPEEIARCVVFLASDDSGFITGSTLTANGGQYHGVATAAAALRIRSSRDCGVRVTDRGRGNDRKNIHCVLPISSEPHSKPATTNGRNCAGGTSMSYSYALPGERFSSGLSRRWLLACTLSQLICVGALAGRRRARAAHAMADRQPGEDRTRSDRSPRSSVSPTAICAAACCAPGSRAFRCALWCLAAAALAAVFTPPVPIFVFDLGPRRGCVGDRSARSRRMSSTG